MNPSQNRGGRPKGIPRLGRYGVGVKTVTVRIPQEWHGRVARVLAELPDIVADYRSRSKPTRDWTQANRLLAELEEILSD